MEPRTMSNSPEMEGAEWMYIVLSQTGEIVERKRLKTTTGKLTTTTALFKIIRFFWWIYCGTNSCSTTVSYMHCESCYNVYHIYTKSMKYNSQYHFAHIHFMTTITLQIRIWTWTLLWVEHTHKCSTLSYLDLRLWCHRGSLVQNPFNLNLFMWNML